MDKPIQNLLDTLDGINLAPLPNKDAVKIETAIRALDWEHAAIYDAAPALLEALEAANIPHTMPAVHKMVENVAGCPGCMARAAIAQAKGESNG